MDERRTQRKLDQVRAQILESRQQIQEPFDRTALLETANEKTRQLSLAASKFQESVSNLRVTELPIDLNAINVRDFLLDSTKVGDETSKLLYEWFRATPQYTEFDKGDSRVLCVSGSPGKGKTTLLLSVARELSEKPLDDDEPNFLSYSFCGSGNQRLQGVTSVLKDLVSVLLDHQPQLGDHIFRKCKSLRRTEFSDPNDFYALSLLFYDMIQDEAFQPTTFIVNAIDECDMDGKDGAVELATMISRTLQLSTKVKWLVSAASPESAIKPALEHASNFNLDASDDHAELRKIFDNVHIPWKVSQLPGIEQCAESSRDEIIEGLREQCSTNFLLADIACETMRQCNPVQRQDIIKRLPKNTPFNMESIYTHMKHELQEPDQGYCDIILSTLAVMYESPRIQEFKQIINFPSHMDIAALIQKGCFAFLELCDETIHFRHPSAREYIRRGMASEIQGAHSRIVENGLNYLSKLLNANDTGDNPAEGISNPKEYVAVHWIRHLNDMNDFEGTENIVTEFLSGHLMLKWMDFLAEEDKLPQIWSMIRDLRMKIGDNKIGHDQSLLPLIYETEQFLQLHCLRGSNVTGGARNTLLFSPMRTQAQTKLLSAEFPQLSIFPGMSTRWSPLVFLLEGHCFPFRSCAYYHGGEFLISASQDLSVQVCSMATGRLQHSFQGFEFLVRNVAVSASGLLAASDGKVVKLWDLATGSLLLPPDGRDLRVDKGDLLHNLAISNDGTSLAVTTAKDFTVWKLPSYTTMFRMNYRTGCDRPVVRDMQFSSDGKRLAVVIANTVSVWELVELDQRSAELLEDTHCVEEIYNFKTGDDDCDSGCVVVFSADSRYVATATGKTPTIQIWDLTPSAKPQSATAILSAHTNDVNAVCFSPDGSRLASGSKDGTIMIWKEPWNCESKEPEMVLQCHGTAVRSLSFRPGQTHLAAFLSDSTVRVWDYGSQAAQTMSELETTDNADNESKKRVSPHTSAVVLITSAKDGEYIASASKDGMICLWEAKSGLLLRTFAGHSKGVSSLVFSHDAKQLISASKDGTARIWHVSGNDELRTLHGQYNAVNCVAISGDGSLVVSGSTDTTVRVWDISQPECGKKQSPVSNNNDSTNYSKRSQSESTDEEGVRVLRGHKDSVTSVAFSQDARFVGAGSLHGDVLLWELSMDEPEKPKKMDTGDYAGPITAVTFLPGVSRMIACSKDTMWIWDTERVQRDEPCKVLHKMNTSVPLRTLQASDKYPDYLITALGPVCMRGPYPAEAKLESTSWCPYSVTKLSTRFGRHEWWITRGGKKCIYLPEMHHPTRQKGSRPVLVCGHTVAIGCGTGEVLFFGLGEVQGG